MSLQFRNMNIQIKSTCTYKHPLLQQFELNNNWLVFRKWKNQRKKNSSVKTIERQAKRKKNFHHYNAEDIKEVLIDNKERDHIVLPSGEEVVSSD